MTDPHANSKFCPDCDTFGGGNPECDTCSDEAVAARDADQ